MTDPSEFRCFDARLREYIARVSRQTAAPLLEEDADPAFKELAVDLFALQFEHNGPYRRLCQARGVSPGALRDWTEIPAVPAAGFKELEFSCLPRESRRAVFYSSGTTGQRRSRHFHSAESLATYEASLWSWFATHLGLTESGYETDGLSLALLAPPSAEAPHSSLVHMFETIRREGRWTETAFLASTGADGAWVLDSERAIEFLAAAGSVAEEVVVLGPAFAFVHLLDEMERRKLKLKLPPGSRLMETGGYKGRSRSVGKAELRATIRACLGIPSDHIVTEYGMSELSSQAYDRVIPAVGTARAGLGAGVAVRRSGILAFPPWARAVVVSPETGGEVNEGETGLIRVYDLANVWSVMAVQTEDLATRQPAGFELLGRSAEAEPRGCSLMPA